MGKIISKVTKERVKEGSGKEFKKGIGGTLSNPCEHKKINTKTIKKPKKVDEGKPIDVKSLEDVKKAIEASSKLNAMKSLDAFVKQDADDLNSNAKITARVKAMGPIADAMTKANVGKDKMDAVIGLAKEVMGWSGNNARNPMMAKIFLKLIGDACATGECGKKQTGLFNPYLLWALERLSEVKFNAMATECLLNTCYQFSPKVVFCSIEKLLLDPNEPNKDPLKNDKNWAPVVKFIGEAIKQFGVDNFYVNRVINIIHQKMP